MTSRDIALSSIPLHENGLWSVPKSHSGETIVCLGSGFSLATVDPLQLAGRTVIACNSAFIWAMNIPNVHLYALVYDWKSIERHLAEYRSLQGRFKAEIVTTNSRIRAKLGDFCRMLEAGPERGLSKDPCQIAHGLSCGHGAVDLAAKLGAARIVLLGYDMRQSAVGATHWDKRIHPKPWVYQHVYRGVFKEIAAGLKEAGVPVLNATKQTALEHFATVGLADALLGRADYLALPFELKTITVQI